ncbi:MAG: hypothetical protein FLDDKLPJ_01016 [Phycisphaerae bacterium]|nr:hypothetical protein [Phycisphaerae bacterium]
MSAFPDPANFHDPDTRVASEVNDGAGNRSGTTRRTLMTTIGKTALKTVPVILLLQPQSTYAASQVSS